jgi:hypothetical protein
MQPRIQEVIEYLDTTRAKLNLAVAEISADRWAERPAPERWSLAEVLEHLNIIEGRVSQMISGRITGAREAGIGAEVEVDSVLDTIDRTRIADRSRPVTAPEAVQPQAAGDPVSAWTTLEESRATLRRAILAGDGLALSEVKQQHPALGLINLYQWMVFVGAHEARHTDQVREIAAEFGKRSMAATDIRA